ncbi:DNA repair protein RecN [Ideonella sp. YS5]|uniref:DNA repair protein RecN n=1 Tax=Ideonella sp. YS5 TaxID=3453714 RepID=UPI003EF0292B
MLKSLTLKDFVIVRALDVEFDAGFSVLTGETGAGKSILIDALQLALGARAENHVVREGAARAEITAAFDAPASLASWLEDAGFDSGEDTLLLRRIVDAKGGSRGFINGSAATVAQLREVADHLIDIHGQHAWQGLTRPASVRALLDEQAGIDPKPLAVAFEAWRDASQALASARTRQGDLASERERLQWQIGELDRLAPGADEWPELNAEHQRLAHAQALLDGAGQAARDISGDDGDSASRLVSRALSALEGVADFDPRLSPVLEVLQGAQAQLEDAAHTLNAYLSRTDLDPERLSELDNRMSAWLSLARRYRRPPEELAALLAEWREALQALDEAADLEGLEQRVAQALAAWQAEAKSVSAARKKAAKPLAQRVTDAMQQLGMAGGRFEVALQPLEEPQSYGLETVEFLVAGHAGSAPRPLGKVASGGELSRLALAIAVTTAQARQQGGASSSPATLIFDEIDSGVGGTVADSVGRLMKQLGRSAQVLAVTHLPQVAACADHHFVVAKATDAGQTLSQVAPVHGEARVGEVARMLGGDRSSGTSLAHAQELIHRAVKT